MLQINGSDPFLFQRQPWWRHQMKTFLPHWPFAQGIHRSPVNSPHKGQWRGALMFSLICIWINGWVNNREAGDLRHYGTHYDVALMSWGPFSYWNVSTLTPTCISDHTSGKVWDKVTYRFPNFNGTTAEAWEWMSYLLSHLLGMALYIQGLKLNHVIYPGT